MIVAASIEGKMIPEDTDFSNTKRETSCTNDTSARVSTTSSWSRLKDPRIVRVSRAFGGKDRHSKVCTVRGLRDRRVRLSVPTAIQLYDLQDRLGLNQPSKVVDWLLNEAKEAIDELPPLQIPQGSLISQSLLHPMFMNAQHHEFLSPHSDKGLKINSSSGINWEKDKDVSGEASHHHRHDQNWGRNHHEEERSQLHLDQNNLQGALSSSTSNFLSRQSIPFPNLFNGNLPYNPPLVRWDPSNMTLSHDPAQRSHESSTSQNSNEDFHHHNFSLVQLPPHIPAGSHPVLVYHQPSTFNPGPSHTSATNTDFESKQADFHGLQLSNSSLTSPGSTQPVMRPFQFHTTANLLPQNTDVDEQNSSNQFHSS